ncbi:glutathione ABC transporter substrate-binding protein [Virgibacillus sp. YIM 98842]|jgi:peptide/nickel transport system substrate-binding protein|uniref:glutathione ABC transporter substrate-binding protein n=1 Tax=Virgibacillus sp. YIM 98842 TaxID=2663533 RepID=UPI0013DAD15F|nr:glutathione ABC transporter substrate-binding protein [Virgibacillus sp. YIM 98842]
MKKIISFMLFIGLVGLLAACASEPDTEADEGATEEGDSGNSLIIAVGSDATELDPHMGTDIPSANVYHNKIFETLVIQDENMEFQPGLATEWERVDDLTWEFTLRDDVEFHDGEPFNAEAVKANLERVVDEEFASPRADLFNMIDEIEVVDEYNIKFTTEYPFSPLLANLAHYSGGIISPQAIEADRSGETLLNEKPVGTGPFIFSSWEPGDEIVLERNDDYWNEPANVETVTFKVIPEGQTRISMIETGNAHIAEPINTNDVIQVEESENMYLYRSEGLGVDYIGFNVQKEPFDNKLVRQAISHALDTETIIDHVYNGVGVYAEGPIGPAVIGHDPDLEGLDYDVEKAKELLAEAGYPDGFETTIWTNDDQARMDAAEVAQSQLSEVGIDVSIEVVEWGAYLEGTANGDHDMFILGWSNMTGDGDYNQYFLFHSDSVGTPGNRSFYVNEEVDALIDEARRETDPDKRVELYQEVQEIEVEEAPLAYLRHTEYIAAVHNSTEGFWMHPSRIMMLNDVVIE